MCMLCMLVALDVGVGVSKKHQYLNCHDATKNGVCTSPWNRFEVLKYETQGVLGFQGLVQTQFLVAS